MGKNIHKKQQQQNSFGHIVATIECSSSVALVVLNENSCHIAEC